MLKHLPVVTRISLYILTPLANLSHHSLTLHCTSIYFWKQMKPLVKTHGSINCTRKYIKLDFTIGDKRGYWQNIHHKEQSSSTKVRNYFFNVTLWSFSHSATPSDLTWKEFIRGSICFFLCPLLARANMYWIECLLSMTLQTNIKQNADTKEVPFSFFFFPWTT